MRRFLIRLAPILSALAVAITSASAQTITITSVAGMAPYPDELYLPVSQFPVFNIEWESTANAVAVALHIDGQAVPFCYDDCAGTGGSITVESESFPGCRHTIQLVASYTSPFATRRSQVVAYWPGDLKGCAGPPKNCEGVGEVGGPVDVATGRMRYEMTDLVIQGPLPIVFTRRYDSQSTLDGPMGYGWRHSYQMKIESGGSGRQILLDQSGHRTYFNRVQAPGGAFIWDENRIDHLVLTQGGTPAWQVTDKHRTKYDFDGNGNVISIHDRNGNTVTVTTAGSTTTITDPFGRAVILTYDGSNRIDTLAAGNRLVDYTYDPVTGNLERVDWFEDGNMTSFVTYDYDDPNEVGTKHNLTQVTDSEGHVVEAHQYDTLDRVTFTRSDGVAPNFNHAYSFFYDTPEPSKTTVRDSLNRDSVYTHDVFHGLIKHSSGPGCTSCGGAGESVTLTYDNFLNVTDRIDALNVKTHMEYDGKGNVTSRTEGIVVPQNPLIERTSTYTYDPTFSFPVTTTVPTIGNAGACGRPTKVITNTYRPDPNANGDLMEQKVEGCNGDTPFTYITTYQYDSHGQVTQVNGPRTDVIQRTTYDYYPDNDTDPNRQGRLQRVANRSTDLLDLATVYDGYDLFGNVGTVSDPNGVVTAYEYDDRDRAIEITVTDPNTMEQFVTESHYDTVGNLDFVRLTNCVAAGAGCAFSQDYVYDGVNRLKEIRDPFGNKVVYTYDTEGNRTREEYFGPGDIDPQSFTNYRYDNFNRLEYVFFNETPVPPAVGSVYFQYTYFDDGTRQTERDPEGHVTTFGYDELRRLTTVTQAVAPDTLTTTYGYDVQDNLKSVTDPNGLQTTYTNSDMGWRLTTVSPDTGPTTYSYDPAGNLTSIVDANHAPDPSSIRSYDALNRLETVSYPDDPGLSVTHSYDVGTYGKGRRTGMIDPSGTSTFQYDARGLLKQEDKVIGSRTYVSGYEHDKNGNLKQVRYPTEDATWRQGQVDYSYDGADRVSLVTAQIEGVTTPVASGFAYKSFGPRKEMTFGNLLVDTRSYGTRYQLDTWTLPPILSYTHTFNNDLNLVARTDNLPSGNNRSFDYDEIHRLTLASAPSLWGAGTACPGSRTYTYDKNGNRQCKGETSTVTTYTYVPGTNRLDEETIGIDATAYSHDLNGNITGVGTRTFHYNDADRLSTVDMGTTASYTYDGDGRRARKTVGTTTTQFFYDPFGRLLTELNTAAGIGTDYLYLLETPIARVDWSIGEQSIGGNDLLVSKNPPNVRLEWSNPSQPSSTYAVRRKRAVDPNDWSFVGNAVIAAVAGTTYDDPVLDDGNDYEYRVFGRTSTDVLFFYHTDHLGTPIAMTNTSGTPEWRAEYLPFGGVHSFPVSGMASNLRFAGQYFDQETELHENGHRFYRPTTGRYDEPDPLGILSDELHPYLYALGNPLHLIDPLGLTSFVGFPPDKERDMRNAVEVVRQKLESEPCCVGGGASQLQQKLDKATFLYRRDLKSKSDPLCGAVGFIDWFKRRAKIGEIAFDSSRCGALQCTVLHEVVHLRIRNAGEASAYAAEKKCFACGTGVPPK